MLFIESCRAEKTKEAYSSSLGVERVFRLYVKSLGEEAVYRVKETVRPAAPIIEALDAIIHPYTRLEQKLEAMQKSLAAVAADLQARRKEESQPNTSNA